MEWNFDMSAAPRGETKNVRRVVGKIETVTEVHFPVLIIAAGADGVTVTATSWLPKQERWNMFSKGHPPIAWASWPDHPVKP